jgi:EAL domain-containing protein (putative c-di-GMP-specific phosphodiesterase class I)
MTEKAFERVVFETQLRQSIEKNQLEVYYQLQMNAKENNIIGMEALVRWNHPDMGLVSPAKFIPLAEDTGFILQLDRWVMKEAIAQFYSWNKEGLNHGVLSLNLSMLVLEQDEFLQAIKDMIKDAKLDTSWLSFEVTETQIMKNPDKSIKKLNELSQLGIKLSIDDFGTGHSSLSYLKKLPIDKLKIDQSFIRDIPTDTDDIEITKTIISMAKNLNLHVIAEGVETQEQLNFLLENDCNEIQGYFYHKPSPASEIEKRLKV